jgi:hypothetical protein
MRFRKLWPLGLLALALASTGCDSGRKNPPDALIRVLNATANYPPLAFWRGAVRTNPIERPIQVDFLGGNQSIWDEDTYNFHVTYLDVKTQGFVELESFSKQIATGTWYTFVLYQKAGGVTHQVLESPPASTTATDVQIQAIHTVEGGPAVDLYIVPPTADIAGVAPWGSLAFEGTVPARSLAAGDYKFVATEKANPAHVLYTTPGFTLSAGAALTLAVTPDSGEGILPFTLTVLNDSSAVLGNPSAPAAVRALNGATDKQPRDVVLNGQFTPPIFPGTVYGTPTPYLATTAATDVPINVTPAGNPGVLESTTGFSPGAGSAWTIFFVGPTGTLLTSPNQDDRRRVKSQAKLKLYNAASICALCDVLILPPGTDPNIYPAFDAFGFDPYPVLALGSVIPVTQWAADFEITVRTAGTTTIVSGPTPITLKDAGLYGIVLLDNPNGTTVDLKLIDDFQ